MVKVRDKFPGVGMLRYARVMMKKSPALLDRCCDLVVAR